MPVDELKAHILTRGAYYQGNLHYSEVPAAQRPRLLDFLNAMARGRQPTAQRTVPTVRMDAVDLTIYRGNSRVQVVCPSVSIVVPSIVIAFDDGPPQRRDTVPPQASYEVRMAQQKEPVVVLTRTRHRIAGKVRGGLKRLVVRTAEEPFIALTDVAIEDLSIENRQAAQLPFVALNMDFTEAFWMG